MNRNPLFRACALAAITALSAACWGCADDGFCFRNCGDEQPDAASGDAGGFGGTGGDGGLIPTEAGNDGWIIETDAQQDGTACVPSNGGIELCDGKDNDCNGVIDETYDLKSPQNCGTCTNNCNSKLANVELSSITCTWDGTPGKEGVCTWKDCAPDYWDMDKNPDNGCEKYCVKSAEDDKTCNKIDDDCDGNKDEDVDLCTSTTDCGKCGGACVVLHGTPACQHPASPPCDTTNTKCGIAACDQGWWDLDNSYGTGCEYECTLSNGGQELCGDGLDNDCNGKIDGADPNVLTDPQLEQDCYGDPDGECATAAHVGKTKCVGQAIQCQGPNVIVQGQLAESCNGKDDDCDGIVDNNLTDVGKSCGVSNIFPCQLGAEQCINGALQCVGAVPPGIETCNGADDDCDGTLDNNLTDISGTCGQSGQGACKLGSKVCQGGVIQCTGNVDPKFETCNGLDDDCDGTADNNLTDTGASCGQSGITPCKLGTIQCASGVLTCLGKIDPSGSETCNGIDDDCNGAVDDNVPGAGASCGQNDIFPCKKGAMTCVSGTMICVGAIDPKPELCNGLDDNCDSIIDNSTIDSGGACGSSEVAPCKKGSLQCQNGSLACVGNVEPKPETCNNVDDNCDGLVDNNPSGMGADCGVNNTAPCSYGKTICSGGTVVCSGNVDPKAETCNGVDDNCNGVVDDGAQGTGVGCGQSNVFPCSYGSMQCVSGALQCIGAINPAIETCNGVDDNCDGAIDKNGNDPPADSQGACNVPTPPPAGATSPCKAGTKACVGGQVQCLGSVLPTSQSDTCGVDANCDGTLTNQPNLQTDVSNCGVCGNNCYAGAVHASFACVSGACVFQGCHQGYYDNGGPGDAVAGDNKCGYACTFVSAQEACNNADDNCNGTIDEGVISPSPVQICGVSPQASSAECTTGVSVACQAGAWKCTFPAGVCSPTCATATELCDSLDNDCDGLLNENVLNYGKPCASDDATPVPGDGACRTLGTIVCNGPSAVKCSAVKADCSSLPGGCTELCDGLDNDCDGSIDETYQAKGVNTTYFVKPAVTRIANALWMYSFEASRPNATTTAPGTGNGYRCNTSPCPGSTPVAPAGVTLDKTTSCSVQAKIPWFNVTAIEAEQTCQAMGGRLCTIADWQGGCDTSPPSATNCTYGYAPLGAPCTTAYTSSKYCNLGPSFDFDPGAQGDQDGLLPTGSTSLQNCYADWTTLLGNSASTGKLFDMTGNLREITKDTSVTPAVYRLMGGSFSSGTEAGATCQFTFYAVAQSFQLYDLGFRCCFTSNPTL